MFIDICCASFLMKSSHIESNTTCDLTPKHQLLVKKYQIYVEDKNRECKTGNGRRNKIFTPHWQEQISKEMDSLKSLVTILFSSASITMPSISAKQDVLIKAIISYQCIICV